MKTFRFIDKNKGLPYGVNAETRAEAETELLDMLGIVFDEAILICSSCGAPLEKKPADGLCGTCRMY